MRKVRIGEAELRLLSYIAECGPASVREVWAGYGQANGYVRTTVQQMMERLRAKGMLDREETEVGLRYAAKAPKAGLLRSAVDRFVRESLGGSVSPFVQYLADAPNLSPEDLQALNELVQRLNEQEERP